MPVISTVLIDIEYNAKIELLRVRRDYYSKYLNSPPQEDPWYVKVLNIERSRPKSFEFVIKVEVAPYIGPHNSVGIDHITFNVNSRGEVKLEKFEHIKSYEIQPGYQNQIKTWPPE